MNDRVNPFNEVYVTEAIGANKFVELFSPVLVESALALYQPGHIILKGLIGTGKSMLLNLLKPDIRVSYYKQDVDFPITSAYTKFIGAGINLRRSGISDFGQRPIVADGFAPEEISPIFFGDFLNYWIVADIFKSIECLNSEKGLSQEIGINFDNNLLDSFAIELSRDECWYGYLEGTNSYLDLKKRLAQRITDYRTYLNFNSKELNTVIQETKSIVGVPIIKTALKLKESGLVHDDTEFYVRLDQYEDLERLNSVGNEIGTKYQEIVHKLLGMRDFSVSYKIGTRDFAWTKESKKIFGTTATLERKRDFNEVSIEELFKRSENRRTLFPKFAEDIFKRRLKFAGYREPEHSQSMIRYVYGGSLSPEKRISEFYVRSSSSKQKVIHLKEDWPQEWNDFLKSQLESSILSAKLAEAWARQKGKGDIVNSIPSMPFPWQNKKWWRKERIEQALMQIASRNGQRLHWSGYEDIMDLCGGSILAFIYVSKYIWDAWLKENQYNFNTDVTPELSRQIQSIGIEKASYYWFEDINSESGGDRRKKFIRFLGNFLYQKLSSDEPMTYPGHNGFSLQKDDLEADPAVNKFLRESSDYGDLDHGEHTSRSKKEGKRIKWHLSKILSPYFRIPSSHTKEPYYTKVSAVREWMVKSEAFTEKELSMTQRNTGDSNQTRLKF
jgi:hypothetical protein